MKNVVLYIGGFILPDRNAAAQRVMANAKIIEELGYQVVFIGIKREMSKSILSSKEQLRGFTTYHLPYPNSLIKWTKQLTSISDIIKVIEQIGRERVRAIIAYNYPSIALERLLKYCRNNSVKLISDCTEWAEIEKPKGLRQLIKNWDTKRRMEKIHPKLDGMIAISDFLTSYYKPRMAAVMKLPPLVDKKDDKWEELSDHVLEEKVQIIYAGSPGNGGKDRIDKIVLALSGIQSKVVNSFELLVIGITKQQYLNDFDQKNLPNNIEANVVFKGRLSHNETIKAVKKAHYSIFVRDENRVTKAGFPTKFVESISCGTPVLTNRTSNIEDYLEAGVLGLFLDVSSNENLEASLLKALNLPKEKTLKMKQNCRHTNTFDVSASKKAFEIFLQII